MDVELDREIRSMLTDASAQSRAFDDARLLGLGWNELLDEDAETAVRAFFEEQGARLSTSSALDSVILTALGGSWTWPAARIVYPLPGRESVDRDGVLEGVVLGHDVDVEWVMPRATPTGLRLYTVHAEFAQVSSTKGVDESLGLSRFRALPSHASEHEIPWTPGLTAGRRALSHELVGLARRMLAIAVQHVSVRQQFGRPLGANQAVQHRLADAQVEILSAAMLAEETWVTATPLAVAAAKALASQAFNTIATNGQQVLGAIGFTWEHEWRHLVRRGFLLSTLLGATDECEREISNEIAAVGVTRIGHLT